MNPLVIEIDDSLLSSNLAEKTKRSYRIRLYEFAEYLSRLIDEPIENVNLSMIYYMQYDNDNKIYDQIDSTILDDFFEAHLFKGYFWLASMKSALSTLFKHLSLTSNFENVIASIEFKLEDHKPEPKIKRVLNRQEILKLVMCIIKYSDNVELDCLLFVTLLSTGCRINEILNLKRRDIHSENNVFF
ncbi:site-specific integrase [Cohnella endophytica]|uniref:Site-specific integrase n=1 Tax=Cohnella endophytica TaxID=2419778 RepID=A0A494XWA1_9BACL|nr:site-specific integrase [Cohnella endophytica]RKP54125.1 site-specific integrase [Cohnella endophytica]